MNTEDEALRNHFSRTPVLVVGGEGFLARNAIVTLAALNADITFLVREQRHPLPARVKELIVGDMREIAVAHEAIAGQKIVLNFAGVTSAVGSKRMPSVRLLEQCLPHLSLIGACAEQTKPPLIVFPGSRLVYGKPVELPVNEHHPTKPTTVYGLHKLTIENYLRVHHETTGLPYIVFRISNPYGPHQLTVRGNGILNTFTRQALSGAPIRLVGDGGPLRDFIFVEDLIKIMLEAIANPACHNDIYNVGGREPVGLADAAQAIATEAGGAPIVFEPWPAEYLKVETVLFWRHYQTGWPATGVRLHSVAQRYRADRGRLSGSGGASLKQPRWQLPHCHCRSRGAAIPRLYAMKPTSYGPRVRVHCTSRQSIGLNGHALAWRRSSSRVARLAN